MSKSTLTKLLMTVSSCVVLAACQTTGTTATPTGEASNAQRIDTALANAAASSHESGQSMPYLERIYKRNSSDPAAAVAYGHALREAGELSRAELVLAPFAKDASGLPQAKTEYAAVQLALGNNESAEEYAQKAILKDDKDYNAYNYLGIALEAQGMHPEAERAFRKALDYWQGDPTSVMNNLALNLASQNYLDEAVEILHKAQAVSPGRMEIERNLRIVMALQQTNGRNAPKPKHKPDLEGVHVPETPIVVPAAVTTITKETAKDEEKENKDAAADREEATEPATATTIRKPGAGNE